LRIERDFSRSSHLFFVGPEADAFTFETEIETEAEPDYNEDSGDEKLDGELETSRYSTEDTSVGRWPCL
jgi:hypothetical protein